MFKYCGECDLKWCQICKACKCGRNEDCSECGKEHTKLYSCEICDLRICFDCSRSLNTGVETCGKCYKNICGLCGSIDCFCDYCIICDKLTSFFCECGTNNICYECSKKDNKCDNCAVRVECPNIGRDYFISHATHRCPECYNVFTDQRKITKKRIKMFILCLKTKKMPKPLQLYICSLSAEYC